MDKIYLLKIADDLPLYDGGNKVHSFYKELTECLDIADQYNIGFTDNDYILVRLNSYKFERIEEVFQKYFIFSKTDVTKEVISGEIQKLYPEVDKLTPKFFENFRIDNTDVDYVLEKISEKGIDSLDSVDRIILKR
mgnify:FL=1